MTCSQVIMETDHRGRGDRHDGGGGGGERGWLDMGGNQGMLNCLNGVIHCLIFRV